MGRIMAGSMMILFVIIVNILVAYFSTAAGEVPAAITTVCGDYEPTSNSTEDFEECGQISKAAFLLMILQVFVAGLPGAPVIVNVLYVSTMAFLTILGVVLITTGVLPFTAE